MCICVQKIHVMLNYAILRFYSTSVQEAKNFALLQGIAIIYLAEYGGQKIY